VPLQNRVLPTGEIVAHLARGHGQPGLHCS